MVAPVSKKELGLSSIIPASSFESIKLKSLSSSNAETPSFLANTDCLSFNKISKQHPKNISNGQFEEENFKLPSSFKGTKTNFSEISTHGDTAMGVSRTESHISEKEKIIFDENSHYSENSIHGAKFMKMFTGKENSQNRIQVFGSENLLFPISSTAFLEDKENIGFNRKRRSTEASQAELTDMLINKEARHRLGDAKPLCFNTENIPKTHRGVSNHPTPSSALDVISKSREGSVDLKNHGNYLSEDLKFNDQKYEHPLLDQKTSAESPKTPEFEYEGMELTAIAGNDDSHFIDDDSFREKQQKESDKSLNMDNSLGLIGMGRTRHYTSDKMELTCTSKYNLELQERSSISSLNNIDKYHSATMSESNNHQFHKDIQPKNSRIHHLACIGKENMSINSNYNESNKENQFKKYADTSLNTYQNDGNEVMNQTLISHEMQLTCTIKTSVTSPFFNDEGAYLTQSPENCSPNFKTLPLNSDDLKIEKDPSNFSKPLYCNEMNNSVLLKEKFVFQSNTMDITCNTESSVGESFNFGNSKNYKPTEDGMLKDPNAEFSLHNKFNLLENHKTRRFDSEGMELTCVASDHEFPSINDDSFEVKIGKESANDLTADHNIKFSDNSRTHHFTSDKMELTCAVNNTADFKKMISNEPFINSHDKNLSFLMRSESSQHYDRAGSQTNQSNVLHSLEAGNNVIVNSMDKEKQYDNCHSLKAFPGDRTSPVLVDGDNLRLPQINGDKYADKTFNSHEMELTLMADKCPKLQVSPFFHLSSHSTSISEEKSALNFQNGEDYLHKKFHITRTYLSSLSKNIGDNVTPPESIPCDAPENKILQTEQPSDSVLSEDNGNGWDVVLKPINSKDASIKMPLGLKKVLSRTPGAVYTLRKKRQQIMNFKKECILSPEVKNILKRSERYNFKKPFSEMKAYSPVSYDNKKSLTFHSFGLEGSFTTGLDESDKLPSVQPFNESHQALNENFGTTSLTPAPTTALLEDSFKTGSKEIKQVPSGQSFNSSLKAMNENSGMTSVTNLIPAPTSAFTSFVRPEANLSSQSNKVSIHEEKYTQNFSRIENNSKSKNFSSHENDSLGLLSDSVLDTSKLLPEKSLLKNESCLVQLAKQDLHLPSETSDFNLDFEKNIINLENPCGNLSLSINQKEIELKDPLLRSESEALNFKTSYNVQNQDISKNFTETGLKCNEIETTFVSEERKVKDVSFNSKSLHGQSVLDFIMSEGSAQESTKNINSSKMKVHDLQKTNDAVSCKQTISLSRNSPCKTNNQERSDPNQLNGMEINDAIWTPNADESIKNINAQATESEFSIEVHDMPTSDCCSSDSGLDLNSLRKKFEESSKGTHWKIKSLKKEEAVFKLEWKVWLYKCIVNIRMKGTFLGESSITLTPCYDDTDDDYEILGYKLFQFLAKDEIVPFSLFSDDMIEKLVQYSNIAERVETLIRDILHVSVDGRHTLSDDLDPLELTVELLNENQMSKFLITFQVNLRTYPSQKIIPEVKHLNFKDITNGVKEAITNVEPGENYLWNMVKLASNI